MRGNGIIRYVYVIDDEEHLKGMVSPEQPPVSPAEPAAVCDLMPETSQTVTIDDRRFGRRRKSSSSTISKPSPSSTTRTGTQGIITMRDTLESRFPEMLEES